MYKWSADDGEEIQMKGKETKEKKKNFQVFFIVGVKPPRSPPYQLALLKHLQHSI